MPETPLPKPIVYACSGCSDAGELADRIARQLARKGVGEMSGDGAKYRARRPSRAATARGRRA